MTDDRNKSSDLGPNGANEEQGEEGLLPDGFEQELVLGRLTADPPEWALNRPEIMAKLQRPGFWRPALTGGVASGKSTVAKLFEGFGAKHIDCDLLARLAVEPGRPGLAAVVELLGPEVLTVEGRLDRSRVARIVFNEPELKAGLENIIHPLVWELMDLELDLYEAEPVVLISVPLLFEAGLESFFSPIILIFAGAEIQLERLLNRQPGLTRADGEKIMASQWPAPPKVMGASYIINNNGSLAETRQQAEKVWRTMGLSSS